MNLPRFLTKFDYQTLNLCEILLFTLQALSPAWSARCWSTRGRACRHSDSSEFSGIDLWSLNGCCESQRFECGDGGGECDSSFGLWEESKVNKCRVWRALVSDVYSLDICHSFSGCGSVLRLKKFHWRDLCFSKLWNGQGDARYCWVSVVAYIETLQFHTRFRSIFITLKMC